MSQEKKQEQEEIMTQDQKTYCGCGVAMLLVFALCAIIGIFYEPDEPNDNDGIIPQQNSRTQSTKIGVSYNELVQGKTYLIMGTEVPLMPCNSNNLSEMLYLPDPGLIEINRVVTNAEWPMNGADEIFPWYVVRLPEFLQYGERCVNSVALINTDDIIPL